MSKKRKKQARDVEIDLLTIVGLELTLAEYKDFVLDGVEPYYEEEALVFGCTKCGECCRRPGVINLTESDIFRIADHMGLAISEFRRVHCTKLGYEWAIKVTRAKACPFYVDDLCTIHEAKPLQCRTYPFWAEYVGAQTSWEDESRDCPGIGEGRSYDADEVEALLVGIGFAN